ncbi:hypothetical protein DFR29_11542 [Tahibacter aquaticus]|uniref:Uncharacterized protein n=1 Tax=Tahibacter aquaticus TaxID=520092 RepID=A0A4R6YPR3_9GAMM|nr:hypothetical protein [Tahibacter aquaticus]TDR39654.1 hypothetical protein DFR29_11542 [Tahibacter aquaticus]
MGTLIAKALSTAAGLAHHTYVECSGGKAWGCYGRKTGGAELVRGAGSTARADRIAEPDERAGITCYGVNGVCHQAANRILLPAGVLVKNARGYRLSYAIYGEYGITLPTKKCHGLLRKHESIGGDLPACLFSGGSAPPDNPDEPSGDDRAFLGLALRLHDALQESDGSPNAQLAFQLAHIELCGMYWVGQRFVGFRDAVFRIQAGFERTRQELQGRRLFGDLPPLGFLESMNVLTVNYQDAMADALPSDVYEDMFQLERDERVILCDPDVLDSGNAPRSA